MVSEAKENRQPKFTLRLQDQLVVSLCVAGCLVAMIVHWCWRGGQQGEFLEVERVMPGTIPYTVDLNQADWVEFTVLPGIGETLAKRIVETRTAQGSFRDVEELARVPGIGPRTVERLRPYLRPLADLESTAEQKTARDSKS
jgi:competence protein ComEA